MPLIESLFHTCSNCRIANLNGVLIPLSEKDMKWFYSTRFSRKFCAHYSVHNKTTTTTTMESNTVSEATASASSSSSPAFIYLMHYCMNSIPSILEPLGDIPGVGGEQQEEEINLDLSVPAAAEDDSDNDSSAVTAIIHDGAAGVAENVAQTEATAPPILTTPPSNLGGSRKQGVATIARATCPVLQRCPCQSHQEQSISCP
jgi:hypothetical protein